MSVQLLMLCMVSLPYTDFPIKIGIQGSIIKTRVLRLMEYLYVFMVVACFVFVLSFVFCFFASFETCFTAFSRIQRAVKLCAYSWLVCCILCNLSFSSLWYLFNFFFFYRTVVGYTNKYTYLRVRSTETIVICANWLLTSVLIDL